MTPLNYQSEEEEAMQSQPSMTKKNPNNRKSDGKGGGGGLNFRNTRVVNMLFSTVLFGLGLLFLIVGIIFVTVYYYPYSFTNFSTILCAGLFIAFGSVVILIALLNIVLVRLERNQLVIMTTFVALVLFIILLILGIWGLIATMSNSMSYEVRQNMQDTISNYDQSNMYHFSTQKINWMQQTFNCCGIVNYMDWKSVFVNSYGPYGFQQQFQPNYYLNQIQPQPNNVPYMSQVPDSCCVRMYANCGKNFNVYQSPSNMANIYGANQYLAGTGNGAGVFQGGTGNYPISGNGVGSWGYNGAQLPNQNIYTQGCLPIYVERYYRELMFMAVYSTIVGGASVLICVVYIILYFMTLKKAF